MREQDHTQACGLYGLGPLAGPRLLAMVCHGDGQAELPLLWQLCQAWTTSGHSVCVLDGTVAESPSNPGLQQVLQASGPAPQPTPAGPWSVLPAALGLRAHVHARHNPESKTQHLSHYLAGFDILVVYDSAERLLELAEVRGTHPIIAITHSRTSLLTSYLALKRLLISAGLRPTIVNMNHTRAAINPGRSPISISLTQCARQFLGIQLHCMDLAVGSESTEVSPSLLRLSQTLIEDTDIWAQPSPCAPGWTAASAQAGSTGWSASRSL